MVDSRTVWAAVLLRGALVKKTLISAATNFASATAVHADEPSDPGAKVADQPNPRKVSIYLGGAALPTESAQFSRSRARPICTPCSDDRPTN